MKRNLKINLEAIQAHEREENEGMCNDGLRVGSLLVSSQGVTSSHGPSYVLSLQDLRVLSEEEGGFLGRGSSGSVRRAVHRRTDEIVALKEIKVTSQAHLSEIRRELETLHAGDVPPSSHLVEFFGAFSYDGSVFIAVECLDGSLDELPKPVPINVLAHMTHSILLGLHYLHRVRHLIHRDLKPNNILFNQLTGAIKISDFGVSSNLECTKGDANSFVGTVTYMSPERLKGEFYSYAADIWSIGLLVAELALGACPYDVLRSGSTEARFWALLQHLSQEGPALLLPPDMDPSLVDFISRCVQKLPEKRPTVTDLLQHEFIVKFCGDTVFVPGKENNALEDMSVILPWLESSLAKQKKRRDRQARTFGDASTRDRSRRDETHATVRSDGSGQTTPIQGKTGSTFPSNASTRTQPYSDAEVARSQHQTTEETKEEEEEAEDTDSQDSSPEVTVGGDLPFQGRTAEPSVNLDDELNKLLF